MSSLSKITLTGKVLRNPEKRFTENNFAITSFTLDFGDEKQEKIIRVFTMGKIAEETAETVKKGQTIVVEGGLQAHNIKTDAGVDKKIFEINARGIEILAKSPESGAESSNAETGFDLNEELNNNDLIGEDEIPF